LTKTPNQFVCRRNHNKLNNLKQISIDGPIKLLGNLIDGGKDKLLVTDWLLISRNTRRFDCPFHQGKSLPVI
jgi:hypothetical protein